MPNERPRMFLTLAEIRNVLNTTNTQADVETRLRKVARTASVTIEKMTFRRFDRSVKMVRHNHRNTANEGDVYDGYKLRVRDDFMTVQTVVNGDGNVLAVDTDYEIVRGDFEVIEALELVNELLYWSGSNTNTRRREVIQVTGEIGVGGRWVNTTTLSGALDDSAAQMSVTAFAGLEQELLIKIDNELMIVTATPASTTVDVLRGANGSTAASHDNGATVYIFEYDYFVKQLARRLLQWIEALEKTPQYGSIVIGDTPTPVDISNAPADVKKQLARLKAIPTIG